MQKIFDAWADLSVRHPYRIFAVATLLFFVFLSFALKLDLKSSLIELLPTDAPSYKNMRQIQKTVASYSTLTVAIESPDLKASERFADDLVKELKKLPPSMVKFIDYNLKPLKDFYKKNKYLYADLKDLKDFRDKLRKRIKEEEEASLIEDLDSDEKPKTKLNIEQLKKKYKKKTKDADRYPDGYFVTPDRKLLAVFIHPPSTLDSYEGSKRLVAAVKKIVDRLDPKKYHPQMKVGFTGEIQTGIEEREALASDMRMIGILALVLILGVVIVYYRSFRILTVIGLPMFLGLAGAFAVAYFAVGYLNSATAFLTSIIAGNGINFPIIFSARYFEERHKFPQKSIKELLASAMKTTAKATLVAAGAASVAYGSLSVAGFRGFQQFGVIGGVGMILCWVSAFATGPAIIVILEKIKPLLKSSFKEAKHPFTNLIGRIDEDHPRMILGFGVLLTIVSIVFLIPYMKDPFEYDFHKLRDRKTVESGSAKLSNKVDTIFKLPQSPMVVLADSAQQAKKIEEIIKKTKGYKKVVGGVKSLWDYLPSQQEEKLKVLADIRRMIDKKIDFLPKKLRKKLKKYRPSDDLHVLTFKDIPEIVAKPYTELNGARGRIVYVYSSPHESQLNGRYLLKFVGFIRKIRVDGKPLLVAGSGPIFADMISAIIHDGIRVTLVALILVIILLFVSFRQITTVMPVLVSVLLAVLWLGGVAAIFDLKLNFLNFVVIPITLGIGVDYGVNLMSRYLLETPPNRVRKSLVSTGGAVLLCSLTTIIGYATLITSTNMALQSFGILADIGEFTALIAAALVMMAYLALKDKKTIKS